MSFERNFLILILFNIWWVGLLHLLNIFKGFGLMFIYGLGSILFALVFYDLKYREG